MSDGFDPLPADVRALVRAEGARVGMPEDARARLAARLAATVPTFGAPHAPGLAGPVAPATPVSTRLGSGAAKAIVALALVAAAAASLVLRHAPLLGDGARSPHAPRVVERAPRDPRVVDAPLDTVRPAPPVATAAPPSRAPAVARDSLREERRLLDLARDAIVRGEPEAALAPTAAHADRFPDGVLAEEREALRIRALARLGRAGEARALLASMRARHPRSFLLGGASADVEAIP